MIKVHIFHTGAVKVDQAIPYKERNPLAVTGFFRPEEKKLVLPVSCYLIQHPKGNLLIDTGWDSKYVSERPHRFFRPVGRNQHAHHKRRGKRGSPFGRAWPVPGGYRLHLIQSHGL